jgi:hypothetical protein
MQIVILIPNRPSMQNMLDVRVKVGVQEMMELCQKEKNYS